MLKSSWLVAVVVLTAALLGWFVTGGRALAWVWDERAEVIGAVGATLLRLGLALGSGLVVGALLALSMRRSSRVEALLTPWVLAFLAIPWLLVMVAVNMVPSLGLHEMTAVAIAGAACAVQVWALGRSRLEERREVYLRRALRYAFTAVMLSELLSRTDGVGAMIRFFSLFTRFDHLALYVVIAALLWLVFDTVERFTLRLYQRAHREVRKPG